MSFFDKLQSAIAENQSLLIAALDPNPEMMPQGYQENKRDLIPSLREWLQFVIEATSDNVCAYKPTLGFYEVLGAAGWELFSQVLSAIPPHIPIILDAKHGDINTSTIFAKTVFADWQIDAITLTPYLGLDHVAPFLVYPDKGVFILCHTSNPGAIPLQEYPTAETPFYLQVVREAKTWGTPEQLSLEVGTIDPNVLARIRSIAPERFILLRSVWAEGGNLNSILATGLNKNGDGLLIPIPQDLLARDDLKTKVKALKDGVNQARSLALGDGQSCELWTSDVCLLDKNPHQDLIIQLYDIGCLLFGEYVQASGATFSYYIDLRKIISNPQIFHQVLSAYAAILEKLTFDRIAGIPYGSLPTATGLSLSLHHPMIYPRKEVKAHGTRRLIEGNFNPGEKVVVIDDILITGKSVLEGAEKLESAGLKVEDIVVFIDHEEGVKSKLASRGYNAYSVLTITEITETLYQSGRISQGQYDSITKNR
jgi:uridine monophosphate synthetase